MEKNTIKHIFFANVSKCENPNKFFVLRRICISFVLRGFLGFLVFFAFVCTMAYSATMPKNTAHSQKYFKYQKPQKSKKEAKTDSKDSKAKSKNDEKPKKLKENPKDSKDSTNEENLIDYSTLSLYYYPYIMTFHKITDKEIATLVRDLDAARKKTGVFLGIYGGWIFHNALASKGYEKGSFLSYGAKVGFQSFYPTMFESVSFPNKVGGRIYLQYLGSNAKELNLYSLGFSAIGISGDLMIDFPVPLAKGLEAGIIAGFGLASMIYDSSSDSTLGGVINLGTSFTLLSKHRIEGEIKLIVNESLDWFGVMPMVGYSYVF